MPTEPMLPESELRSRVLQRIEDGRLPLMLSTRIDAGYGTGDRCDLCDQPIAADKVEYDITDPDSRKRLYFHIACHLAWQRECALRLRDFRPCSTQGG
jgi:hypothetical protein